MQHHFTLMLHAIAGILQAPDVHTWTQHAVPCWLLRHHPSMCDFKLEGLHSDKIFI